MRRSGSSRNAGTSRPSLGCGTQRTTWRGRPREHHRRPRVNLAFKARVRLARARVQRYNHLRSTGRRSPRARPFAGLLAALAALSLGVAAGSARPVSGVTITMIMSTANKPGYDVLIPNFERAYPDIHVNITYPPTATAVAQHESTELAAGDAPELLMSFPGCGTSIAICVLGKAGHLAPMRKKPWTKRSLPFVTSQDKLGKALLAFTPTVQPMGMFTNDDRFSQLGLKVPQTFAQL